MGGTPSFSIQQQPDYSAAIIKAMNESNAAIAAAQAAYQEKALALSEKQNAAQLEYNKWAQEQQRSFEGTQAELQRKFQDEFTTKQQAAAAALAKQQQEREIQAAKDRESAVKLAQDQAAYRSAVESANQQAMIGQNYATQQLGAQDAVQKAYDAASAADYAQQSAGAGKSYTGPSFDYTGTQQQQAQNLRAASPKLSPAAYNSTMQKMNPSDKTAASMYANQLGSTQQQFKSPDLSGIKFGGVA